MGFWSASLFGNDITEDVRDTYLALLKDGTSDEEAYQKVLSEYEEVIQSDEEPFFWYALAQTQWKIGRLSEKVKNKAFYFIEQKGGADFFEDEFPRNNPWLKTLQKLKTTLESEMKPYKKFRKVKPYVTNPWNVGDVYAYQFHTDYAKKKGIYGKYILFHKLDDKIYYLDKKEPLCSVVCVYNRIFNQLPSIDTIEGLQMLPSFSLDGDENISELVNNGFPSFEFYQISIMILYRKHDFPEEYMYFVGNKKVTLKEKYDYRDMFWAKESMEYDLVECALSWKDIRY